MSKKHPPSVLPWLAATLFILLLAVLTSPAHSHESNMNPLRKLVSASVGAVVGCGYEIPEEQNAKFVAMMLPIYGVADERALADYAIGHGLFDEVRDAFAEDSAEFCYQAMQDYAELLTVRVS